MDHLIQIPQVGRAWEPIPEPWVTLGLLAGLDTGLRLGTLVTPGDLPPGRGAGQDRRHPRRADRRPGLLRARRRLVGPRARRRSGCRSRPPRERLDQLEAAIETMRALWAPGHQGRTRASGSRCRRPPAIRGRSATPDHRRRLRRAPHPAHRGPARRRLQPARPTWPSWTASCRAARALRARPAATRPSLPSPCSTSRSSARPRARGRLVERLRGRTAAATFAARHHAGPPRDHIDRYRQLAERGVRTVFVALPDLAGPDEVRRLAPVTPRSGRRPVRPRITNIAVVFPRALSFPGR